MTAELVVGLNYLACLAASTVFLLLLQRRRELLIKPSMQILLYTHVFIQWPFVVRHELVTSILPFPADAFLLIHGFVLVGLAVSLRTWHGPAREIFLRVTDAGVNYVDQAMPYVAAVLGLCAVAVVIYVRAVPFSQMGLFVAMVNPDLAEAAREESFKLLDSTLVRYSFSLQTSTFAPLGAVLVYGMLELAIRKRRLISAFAWAGILLGLLLIVSLTGARMFAALIVFSIIMAVVIRRGFRINPVWIVAAAAIVIMPAVILTLLREGLLGDYALVPAYLWEFLGHRVFGAPLEVGLFYMHHEQVFGEFGIRGIPRVAEAFGLPALNVPNYIGLMYIDTPLVSISAVGGYLFAFYAYFGMIALPMGLLALWSLDLFLLILVRLDAQLLLPALAAMAAAGLSFLQSDFPVTLVSHGYGLIPVVAFMLVIIRRAIVNQTTSAKDSIPPG